MFYFITMENLSETKIPPRQQVSDKCKASGNIQISTSDTKDDPSSIFLHSCPLLALSDSAIVNLFEFVDFDCLFFLEMSLVSFRLRKLFLAHLNTLKSISLTTPVNTKLMSWLEHRKLKVHEMTIDSGANAESIKKFVSWKFLKKLSFRGCKNFSSPIIIKIIKESEILEYLDLSDLTRLTDSVLLVIAESNCRRHLRSIDISRCVDITDTGIMSLGKSCPNLESLIVNSCGNITNTSILSVVKKCPQLVELGLESCQSITDATVKAVARAYPLLKYLNLANCRDDITDASISLLAECCLHLEFIDLANCWNITDTGVVELAKRCHKLKSVSVAECRRITDAGILSLASHSSLENLNLKWCWKLTDASILGVTNNCPTLKHLSLGACKNITDACILQIAGTLPLLETLDLMACELISDRSIIEFTRQRGRSLKRLNLAKCLEVTDRSMEAIAFSCPYLESLVIAMCRNITDAGVQVVVKNCNRLSYLDMSFCDKITDSSIETIIGKTSQNIKSLRVTRCDYISGPALKSIAHFRII